MITLSLGNRNFNLQDYIHSLIKGDREKCLSFINKYLETNPNPTKIYEEVIRPSLYRVGDMWESNEISVANEHLATSTSEFLLNHIHQSIHSNQKVGKKVVIAGIEKEIHQIGIKIVADCFEKSGWETFCLGANVSAKDIILFVKTTNPDLLALSLSLYNNLPDLEKTMVKIREVYPHIPIIIGGRAFLTGRRQLANKFRSAFYIPDLYALDIFIQNQNE
ncbi:MAG: cobalamin-dependent protein [Leptospiraceae bacterium]|nr:cobalamin-dependent protein [Leptospiraceae bacterium]